MNKVMCPSCAALNWEKRHQSPKLDSSFIALVTGGRVKIGFHTALKLLYSGATVVVTSRFRNDALERFAAQPDFEVEVLSVSESMHCAVGVDFITLRGRRLQYP